MQLNRRELLYGAAATAAATCFSGHLIAQVKKVAASCPFHLAVINDEISPDLDHAAHIVANEFGLQHIELRSINGKGLHNMSPDELNEAKKILSKYQLKVTDIGSPLFKSDLPGATIISLGQRPAPDGRHDRQLALERNGQGAALVPAGTRVLANAT